MAGTRLAPGRVVGWTDGAEAVPSEYLQALRRSGVVPAVIGGDAPDPPRRRDVLRSPRGHNPHSLVEEEIRGRTRDLLGPCDGLMLCGGADIDPALYGEVPHPSVYGVDDERDRREVALVTAALEQRLPILAVCRGIQVLNVALGGTLVQHVPDLRGAVAHGLPGTGGARVTHPVEVAPASRLSEAIGGATHIDTCVSVHHQAVGRLAAPLVVVARSPDGLIEAVEPADPTQWCVAVQWHPERSAVDDDVQQAIFDGFAAAAAAYAGARP